MTTEPRRTLSLSYKSFSGVVFYFCFSLLFLGVHGGWGDPPYFTVPGGPEEIKLDGKTLSIPENVGDPNGFALIQLNLIGSPGVEFVNDAVANNLSLVPITGGDGTTNWYMHRTEPFDYEKPGDGGNFIFVVFKEIGGDSSSERDIYVNVTDVNDNIPVIQTQEPNPIQAITELEEPSPNPILTVFAVDADVNDILSYELIEGKESFEIRMTEKEAKVFQTKMLNYTQLNRHRLVIKISDGDDDLAHHVNASDTVLVVDIPNLPPQFTRPPIFRSVREETEIGTEISIVLAQDGDYGLNFEIEYDLIEDGSKYFEIDKTSGSIRVKERIDAEDAMFSDLSYDFTVIANEKYNEEEYPNLPIEVTQNSYPVAFTIDDIDDNGPLICQQQSPEIETCSNEKDFSFEIFENHTGLIPLDDGYIIRAIDLDPTSKFNQFEVDFVDGTDEIIRKAFQISPRRGMGEQEFSISVINRDGIDFESGNWQSPRSFRIEFKGTPNDTHDHIAYAQIKVLVKDVNDWSPEFDKPQYEFHVCENIKTGDVLKNMKPNSDPTLAKSCKFSVPEDDIYVSATDKDLTPEFGDGSIIYRWIGREPPIALDPQTGKMTINTDNIATFDYERFKEEPFVVEAVDMYGNENEAEKRSSSVSVVFKILDVNDMPVDLTFKNVRESIVENDTSKFPVLDGITAKDVDENGKITFSLSFNNAFRKEYTLSENEGLSPYYKQIEVDDDLEAKMKKWFKLEEANGNDTYKELRLVFGDDLGEDKPDREGYGERDVDRVDLTITVNDENSETGDTAQIAYQVVVISINDTNDNRPEWREGTDNFTGIVTETEWDNNEDTSSELQREIYRLSALDKDRDTIFYFSLRNEGEDCKFDKQICDEILNMFELESNPGGTAILRRKANVTIDREARQYFTDDNDILNITVIVTDKLEEDKDHWTYAKFKITIDDRNDNTPQFQDNIPQLEMYYVNEVEENAREIVKMNATDKDNPARYGNVSYHIFRDGANNGDGKFNMGFLGGELTAIPGKGVYDWFERSTYTIEVTAIDNYRNTSSSGSNWNTTFINITVIDINDNAPEFQPHNPPGDTPEDPLARINEREVDVSKSLATIRIQDKDDPSLPNGDFSVIIDKIEKVPDDLDEEALKKLFRLELGPSGDKNIRDIEIFATKNFTGIWGNYTITLKAMDMADPPLDNESTYVIRINNENLNSPVFEVIPGNGKLLQISIKDSEPDADLKHLGDNSTIPNVKATDKDYGSEDGNGDVWYSMQSTNVDDDCEDLFQINSDTGKITLKKKLDNSHANLRCEFEIIASDKGLRPNRKSAFVEFALLVDDNEDPLFAQSLMTVHILENCSAATSTPFDHAKDMDKENDNCFYDKHCDMHYFLKGGDSDMFDLIVFEEPNPILQLKPKDGKVIDYESAKTYDVTIYVTNDPDEEVPDKNPEDALEDDCRQWAVIRVVVDDRLDTAPEFVGLANGILTGGFTGNADIERVVGVVAALDKDLNDRITFEITSNFTATPGLPNNQSIPPFQLDQKLESPNTTEIILKFQPAPSFKGRYTFEITATDSVGFQTTAECRIYVIASKNVVNFYFSTPSYEEISREITKSNLSAILGNAFSNPTRSSRVIPSPLSCNIDHAYPNTAASDVTIVETHFVNVTNNNPVLGDYIQGQQFHPVFYKSLVNTLASSGFTLQRIGESDEIPESDIGQIITFVLIGGVAVLVISLLILAATCFYNNKGLKLRVRALTAITFGSTQSDLNRLGLSTEAPNTNAFAVEGSNPIWTVDADKRKIPDFDTESIGSGGSVLIGAEDEDYFQKSSKNPVFQSEDVVANYDSDNDMSDRRSYTNNDPFYGDDNNAKDSIDLSDSPFPTKITKNPLVNLGEAQMSDDEGDGDGYGDASFQFEANTDSGLF